MNDKMTKDFILIIYRIELHLNKNIKMENDQ